MLFKVLPHIIIWCALIVFFLISKRAAIEKKEKKELHATNKKKLYVGNACQVYCVYIAFSTSVPYF